MAEKTLEKLSVEKYITASLYNLFHQYLIGIEADKALDYSLILSYLNLT